MGLLLENDGNKHICKRISYNTPFMVGRLGAVEMRCVEKWMKRKQYTKKEIEQIYFAAGVFPNDKNTIDKFCELYVDSILHIDALSVWGITAEKKVIQKYCPSVTLMPLRALEPYYHENPWSKMLEGKKVLVVHPFVESMKRQYMNREKLFENDDILPKFDSITFVKAIQSNAGGKTEYESWFDAFEYMKSQISKKEFDVAIIGAGAYGLPLAAYIKSLGKQAIQMGGSTQILFGIKGKRWDCHPYISKLYNENWIRPSDDETPSQIQMVEGGSYW